MAINKDVPGDIDVVADCRGMSCDMSTNAGLRQLAEYFDLIRIAHQHYGSVDPFLRFDNCLLVRNGRATGWLRAKQARALGKVMDDQAVPLADVIERFRNKLVTRGLS